MTSTTFNVGLGDGNRASSRVLRPPGGGHTDIFGGEPEPPRTGRRMHNPAQIAAAASAEDTPTSLEPPRTGRRMHNPAQIAATASAVASAKSSISELPEQNGQKEAPQAEIAPAAPAPAEPAPVAAEPAGDAPQAAAEPAEPAKTEQAKVQQPLPDAQPQRRGRVPPGGFSSGLW